MNGDAEPQDATFHRRTAMQKLQADDELGALSHLIAAQTLEARQAGSTQAPIELQNVATGYFMKGDHDAALRWYELVLTLQPDMPVAHQNLAAIHAERGDSAKADASRERAYRLQRVFVEAAAEPSRRLLILCAGRTSGNVPFDTLLSSGDATRIKYAIDFAADDEDAQLPAFDLVFNAIGEPDVAVALSDRLRRFEARCAQPWLNRPEAVERTQRHRLEELLGDIEGVALAPCSRHGRPPVSREKLVERLAAAGIDPPLLVRPSASHGGRGLVRCDDIDTALAATRGIAGAHYLTAFRDSRSDDGAWRKYRVVFVDGTPLPYHLAISSHWMVHYFSADMLDGGNLDEERRFLDDPVGVLGQNAMAAVTAIGKRLGLDYAGIDFSVLPDGRIFVFEANATMLVHRERASGALAFRNAHVQRIVDAFECMQARRLAGFRMPVDNL